MGANIFLTLRLSRLHINYFKYVIQPPHKDEEDYSTIIGSRDDFCYTHTHTYK